VPSTLIYKLALLESSQSPPPEFQEAGKIPHIRGISVTGFEARIERIFSDFAITIDLVGAHKEILADQAQQEGFPGLDRALYMAFQMKVETIPRKELIGKLFGWSPLGNIFV
jgi:hypothetical protein